MTKVVNYKEEFRKTPIYHYELLASAMLSVVETATREAIKNKWEKTKKLAKHMKEVAINEDDLPADIMERISGEVIKDILKD